MLFHVVSLYTVPAVLRESFYVSLMCTPHYAKRSPIELAFEEHCFRRGWRGRKTPRRNEKRKNKTGEGDDGAAHLRKTGIRTREMQRESLFSLQLYCFLSTEMVV